MSLLLLFAGASVAAPAASADVVLNEINCEATDWIELVNVGDTPADISGWRVTDRPLDSTDETHRMFFPAETMIAPNDDLVVEKGTGGYPLFPFGISCGDDTIRLGDAAGNPVDDIVVPTLLSSADTWGRYPNGTGEWRETIPTKGTPNEPSTSGGDPQDDLAAWLFDPGEVVDIDLDLSAESIDALNADPDTYVDGQFSLTAPGASYGPLAVGVRLKGHTSFRPLTEKAAFKVKFSHLVAGQRFVGLKHLTLNNMVQDPSEVHETLAYEAFRAIGVPAPRTGYATVNVNDELYGLYLNLETMDEVALRRLFDTTQHLYEGQLATDVTPGGEGGFEVDEGNESDTSDLQALIAAVNDPALPDWSDGVASVADLPELTRAWAVERYIGHWDGYAGKDGPFFPNNYYLHSDDSGLFDQIPWGTDETFGERLPFDWSAGIMFDHCLADPSCAADYKEAVLETRSTITGLDLASRAATLAAQLAPWQAIASREEWTAEDVAVGIDLTRAYIAARPGDVDSWLVGPAQTIVPAGSPSQPTIFGVKSKRCKKRSSKPGGKCRKWKAGAKRA